MTEQHLTHAVDVGSGPANASPLSDPSSTCHHIAGGLGISVEISECVVRHQPNTLISKSKGSFFGLSISV